MDIEAELEKTFGDFGALVGAWGEDKRAMVLKALGPERDWADEAWMGAFSQWQNTRGMGGHDVAAAVIRTRCRPIGNDTVTDEWLETRLQILKSDIRYSFKDAVKTLRAIIAEATQ